MYYANMRLPKTPEEGLKAGSKYYTQDVINKLVKSINETTGYHVVKISNSETEDILTIAINTDVIDGILFE